MRFVSVLVMVLLLSGFAAADGIIVPVPPRPPIMPPEPVMPPLEVKYHHVTVEVDNQYSTTEVDQAFRNQWNMELEGTYLFPLPKGSSISRFSMYVEGERLDGELMEKDEALQTYQSIVRQMKDPALLEYAGRNTFRARVYPIPARGEKRLQLEYDEVVNCDDNLCKYSYPLKIEGLSPKPLDDVTITVSIRSNKPIKTVYSPTHQVEVDKLDDYNVEVSYEARNVKPGEDFEVYYTLSDEDFGLNLLSHRVDGEDGYYMLMVSPKQELQEDEVIPKDIVFVLDTSGSMAGDKIVQAKNALKFCINSLNEEDRFGLITFSSTVEKYSDGLIGTGTENIDGAVDFVNDIEAVGGTNINDALLEALAQVGEGDNTKIIVFLTDGKPTVGTRDTDKILASVKDGNEVKARVFVFGVGYDVNTHLLDQISGENSGVSEYVKPEEDIEVKVSNFYTKVSTPVLSDLDIDYEDVRTYDQYPKTLPDLFKGSQLIILGRYEDAGDTVIELEGKAAGRTRSFTYEGTFEEDEEDNAFIPRLWATKKIGYLLDDIRLNGESQEVVDEIINLSLKYGIMTPYTSFLVDLDTDITPTPTEPTVWEKARQYMSDSLSVNRMYEESGAGAVKSAEAVQSLKDQSTVQIKEDKLQAVGAKTFYLKGETWVDNGYTGQETTDVKYDSNAYYQMLTDRPEYGKYLSLGEKVIFCEGGECYKIGIEGEGGTIGLPTTTTLEYTTTTVGGTPPTVRDTTTTLGESGAEEDSGGGILLIALGAGALLAAAAVAVKMLKR
ncbi:MAG: VWA domain-containing protein [Candidatus Altiarchaeales archaeon]|nr:VWA domain-containing protein [Candidatus Altiarchaeales archaeon]